MSTSNNKYNNTEEIDLIDLAITILKKWYIFVIFGFFCLSIAVYHVFSTPSEYRTTGTVLIRGDQAITSFMGLDASFAADFLNIGTAVDNEKIIFQSKTILSQLIDELDLQTSAFYQKQLGGYHQLYNNEPFIVIFPNDYKKDIKGELKIDVKKTKNSTWEIKFKHKWKYRVTKFKAELTDLSQPLQTPWGQFGFIEDTTYIDPKYPNYKLRFITVSKKSRIDEYTQNLTIAISNKKANAIDVIIEGGNVLKNEAIVNKIIELYNKNNTTDKTTTTLETLKTIENRINVIKNDLTTIDYKVEEYRIKNQLADLSAQSELLIESANTYETTLTEIEMNYTLMSYIENHVQNSDSIQLIPNTNISEGALSDLISTYNTNVINYLRIKRSTNENNPYIIQLKNDILLIRDNILQTIQNAKESLAIEKQEFLQRTNEMNKIFSSIPTIEREYVELVQEQTIKRTIYVFLLQQYENIQTMLVSQSSQTRIIDPAYTPEKPIAPRKLVSLFIAIFFAALLGLIYIFLESLLNNKITNQKQLNKLTTIPIISNIPTTREKNIIIQKDDNAISNSYRTLRTKFIINNYKTILLTNDINDEVNNNYPIALNLALSFTFINKKVAFVDINTLNNTHNSQYPNIDIYPINQSNDNISDIIMSDNFKETIANIQNKYDYVIINSTPVESDAFSILNQYADTILYVCSQNKTKKENIKQLNELSNNINNISILYTM